MDNPLVSVIMAVKNGERFLAAAIESVLASDYRPLEIIVVDGQSEDRTADIARSFPEVSYIRQTHSGVADAYNVGIAAANGDFIAFNSHDDLWLPHKLSRQMEYLLQHPETQYTVTKIKYFLEPGCALPATFRPELLHQEPVARIMETLVVRKSLFAQIGTFNTSYATAEDVDWYARAKDQNIPMAIIPEVLVYKRVHDKNTASDADANNQRLLHLLRRSIQRQRE